MKNFNKTWGYWSFWCLPFITIPSRTPSVPKLPQNCWGSTGPGSWNDMEKCPGGQRFCVCISNTWEYLYTVFSPVVVTPCINTLPSISTSQLNSPAVREKSYQSLIVRPIRVKQEAIRAIGKHEMILMSS